MADLYRVGAQTLWKSRNGQWEIQRDLYEAADEEGTREEADVPMLWRRNPHYEPDPWLREEGEDEWVTVKVTASLPKNVLTACRKYGVEG